METHSLFSLEIVVEKLYLPNVSCRFPTIACKLLDFPVITIDLVDKSTAESIRKTIKSKADQNIPDQFECLKDYEDTFSFRHGKSCLFKICPQTLKSLLLNAPLYVMVLDTMPSPPKLTGNASVPLDMAIKKICKDLVKNGPDIPAIYKDTGLLRIYNLMAKEIGYLTFGYRLLYLGSTLLPHISEEKSKVDVAKSEKILQNNESVGDIKNRPIALQSMLRCSGHLKEVKKKTEIDFHTEMSVKTASHEEETIPQIIISDKNVNITNSEPVLTKEDNLKDFKVSGDNNESINQINKNYKLFDKLKIQPEEKDPFQLYCPPPIFYRKSNSKILSLDPEISDPDTLNHKGYKVEEKLQPSDVDKTFGDGIQQFKDNNLPNVLIQKPEKTFQNNPNTKLSDNLLATELNKYPYLSGILKELSLIDIPGVIQQISDHLNVQNSLKVSAQDKNQQRGKSRQCSSAPTRHTRGNTSGMEKHIPKNKSWIRCTEQLSGRKSSLEFGLTKTHILRLNKLKTFDDEERENRKFKKAEKESTFKVKMCTRCLKLSKNNNPKLQEETRSKTSTNIVQEIEHIIKDRNEKVENVVNVSEERNEVVGNMVNVMRKRNEAEEVRLSENDLAISMAEIGELPMKVIQKELEELEKSVFKEENKLEEENKRDQIKKQSLVLTDINKTDETMSENKNKSDISIKFSSYSNEESAESLKSKTEYDDKFSNSDADESNKNQKTHKRNSTDSEEWQRKELKPVKKTDSTDSEEWQRKELKPVKKTDSTDSEEWQKKELKPVKKTDSTDSEEWQRKELKPVKKTDSTDSEEWQRKELKPVKKTDSLPKTSVLKDNNRPPTIEKFKEKQKVLSFEEPDVTVHQNLSPLVPLSSTSPQPRFSRGPSLQESNASYSSSMLSETPLPTPRTRRHPLLIKKDSIHTDSVSSYRPSEDNDDIMSRSSSRHSKSPEDYSDDFLPSESDDEEEEEKVVSSFEGQDKPPKIISENKLGYTIW